MSNYEIGGYIEKEKDEKKPRCHWGQLVQTGGKIEAP